MMASEPTQLGVVRRLRPRVFILNDRFEIALQDSADPFVMSAHDTVYERDAVPAPLIVDGTTYDVRVIEMQGSDPNLRFAVLFDHRRTRDPLARAALRYRLTERECDVLERIVEGHSNREIARELYIAEATLQDHIHNLCVKIGARRRGDLLANVFEATDV